MTALTRLLSSASLLILTLGSVAHADDRCARGVAELMSAPGVVEVQVPGNDAWLPVAHGAPLCAGDKLAVRGGSRALVRLFADETNVQLGENSTLVIPAVSGSVATVVEFPAGVAHFISRAPSTLTVKTPWVSATTQVAEFVVKVNDKETLVAVMDGEVNASSDAGAQLAGAGENVLTTAVGSPRKITFDDPAELVQWTLYYPPVVDFERYDFSRTVAERWRPAAAESVSAWRSGNLRQALELLAEVPDDVRDVRLHVYRAALLLAAGNVSSARAQLSDAASIDPKYVDAVAMQAMIATVHNQRDIALTLATQAVNLAPDSASALLAMSYAQQARFNLKEALRVTQHAVNKNENNALVWGRLAELWMMLGELEQADAAVRWAVKYNPDLSQAHTVRGFAALQRGDFEEARNLFDAAARLDPSAPMPHVGMGLTRVRLGDLAAGRTELEVAVSLDSRNSLLRSYAGKAYFDEKRDALADRQFAQAKELDPADPTPWFYDALLKQAQNRPVEALQNIQKSIALNDNRAVYRSRLLLDEDRAARGGNHARVHTELGFNQLALSQGTQSVNIDPTNYSSHRFLSDAYASLPRHEIARVSELMQAQLLQPLVINPVKPELSESDMAILNGSDVLTGGLNEYSSLLMRGGFGSRVGALGASNETIAGEVALSYLGDHSSTSAGQFHFETDGFRDNADYQRDVVSAFHQTMLGTYTSAQIEIRRSETEHGDIAQRFDRDRFFTADRHRVDTATQRVGVHHQFDSASDLLLSLVRRQRERSGSLSRSTPALSTNIDSASDEKSYLGELQYIGRNSESYVVTGLVYVDNEGDGDETRVESDGVTTTSNAQAQPVNVLHNNAYLYWSQSNPNRPQFTVGLSYDLYEDIEVDRYKFNPKLGMVWNVTPSSTWRAAAFRTVKRELVADQTLEPVQVAGFNQFFDDVNASIAIRYGLGYDHHFSPRAHAGVESTRRELEVPVSGEDEEFVELAHRAYYYWAPITSIALGAEYFFEQFWREAMPVDASEPRALSTHRLPVTLQISGPLGWSVQLRATVVRQTVRLPGVVGIGTEEDDTQFELLDLVLGYRFAKGTGIASLAVNNVFDQQFGFEDDNFQTAEPRIPLFYPERTITMRLGLRF